MERSIEKTFVCIHYTLSFLPFPEKEEIYAKEMELSVNLDDAYKNFQLSLTTHQQKPGKGTITLVTKTID